MPFDRMVRLVDEWAGQNPEMHLFAQIGESEFQPKSMEFATLLSRADFDHYLRKCEAVVAHAGTGTIIQALLCGKPLLVFPRLSSFSETRNDHQVGTARHFAEKGFVMAAFSDEELMAQLAKLEGFKPTMHPSPNASPALISRIRDFCGQGIIQSGQD
jgi:UDP-N-acetylglucosamine transferase subunit ALG13